MQRAEFLVGGAAAAVLGPGAATRTEVLRIVAAPIGHGIDPYGSGQAGIDELAWLYGDGLVGWDRGPVPLLADLPERSDDGVMLRYRLRSAIWHDGRPVRADDVRAAWLTLKGLGYHPYTAVRDVLPNSDREFVVRLGSPVHGFVRSFFGPYGTPAMPLLRHADDGIPIGTGPFVPGRHPDPDRWTMERWNASPRGRPKLAAVDLRVITYDTTAAIQLASGEADIAYPLPSARSYSWSSRFVRRRRITSVVFLVFNTRGNLDTAMLRRWFVSAIDLGAIQRRFDADARVLFTSYTMPERSTSELTRLAQFSSAAREMLQAALGGRSVRVLYVAGNPVYEAVAAELQQNLGGESYAQTRHFAPTVLLARDGPLYRGLFDVAIIGLPYDDEPDLAPQWACRNRAPSGANVSRWCDRPFEAAIARHDVAAAFGRIVDEMVCVPLGPAREDIGLDPRVDGFPTPPPYVVFPYSCTRWAVRSR